MKLRALAFLLAAATAAFGADRQFDRLVREIEHQYGVKHTRIPMMGVANFALKLARPAGASSFRLAVFDDLPSPGTFRDTQALDRFIDDFCRGGMHPLMVAHSRVEGESEYILAGDAGKYTKLLIGVFERREATVIETEVNMDLLIQLLSSPDGLRRVFGVGVQKGDEGY